jgi:Subtilisin inhibitor-like
MRAAGLICLLAAATVSACGAGAPSARVDHAPPATGRPSSPGRTELAIWVYPRGIGQPGARHYRLACDPARGTVPHPAQACRVLAHLSHPFAPVPPGTACGQIVLGPAEARVAGLMRGRRVGALLSLRDTCEIGRWSRLRAVVPGYPRP